MNSSRETLLREEEEEKKRSMYPIGLENIQGASPLGQTICPQNNIPERKTTNSPTELLSDDDGSDWILLKDLKPPTSCDPEYRQENLAQEQMEIRQETLRKDETNIEKEKEATMKSTKQIRNNQHKTNSRKNNPINYQTTEPDTRTNIWKQPKDLTYTTNLSKLTVKAKWKASSPMKSPPPR